MLRAVAIAILTSGTSTAAAQGSVNLSIFTLPGVVDFLLLLIPGYLAVHYLAACLRAWLPGYFARKEGRAQTKSDHAALPRVTFEIGNISTLIMNLSISTAASLIADWIAQVGNTDMFRITYIQLTGDPTPLTFALIPPLLNHLSVAIIIAFISAAACLLPAFDLFQKRPVDPWQSFWENMTTEHSAVVHMTSGDHIVGSVINAHPTQLSDTIVIEGIVVSNNPPLLDIAPEIHQLEVPPISEDDFEPNTDVENSTQREIGIAKQTITVLLRHADYIIMTPGPDSDGSNSGEQVAFQLRPDVTPPPTVDHVYSR